jgi:hypothetical protein
MKKCFLIGTIVLFGTFTSTTLISMEKGHKKSTLKKNKKIKNVEINANGNSTVTFYHQVDTIICNEGESFSWSLIDFVLGKKFRKIIYSPFRSSIGAYINSIGSYVARICVLWWWGETLPQFHEKNTEMQHRDSGVPMHSAETSLLPQGDPLYQQSNKYPYMQSETPNTQCTKLYPELLVNNTGYGQAQSGPTSFCGAPEFQPYRPIYPSPTSITDAQNYTAVFPQGIFVSGLPIPSYNPELNDLLSGANAPTFDAPVQEKWQIISIECERQAKVEIRLNPNNEEGPFRADDNRFRIDRNVLKIKSGYHLFNLPWLRSRTLTIC